MSQGSENEDGEVQNDSAENLDNDKSSQNGSVKGEEESGGEGEEGEKKEKTFVTPRKKSKVDDLLGTSLVQIPGTPILSNITEVDRVPTSEKFSENICEHKAFEMESNTPTGSYQKIVDLTRSFKSNPAMSTSP
jgi:hypothetical protein